MGDGKVEIKAGMDLGCKTIALKSRDNAGILFDTKILPLKPHGIMSSHFEPVSELVDFFLPQQKLRRHSLMEVAAASLMNLLKSDRSTALAVLEEVNKRRQEYFSAALNDLLRTNTDFAIAIPKKLSDSTGRETIAVPPMLDRYLQIEAAEMAQASIADSGSYCNRKLRDRQDGRQGFGTGSKYMIEITYYDLLLSYRDVFKRFYGYMDFDNLPEDKLLILRTLMSSSSSPSMAPVDIGRGQDIRSAMTLDIPAMQNISEGMIAHMAAGLAGEESSLDMTPTYVTAPTGREKGDYFAIDVGGSNLRVMGVRLDGKGGYTEIGKQKVVEFQARQKTGTQEELFDFITNTVRSYLTENSIDTSEQIRMGLSWSFPVDLSGIASARHKEWTKGWDVSGVVGEDIVALMHAAFKRGAIGSAKIVALCNDTTGTLAAARYAGHSDCVGGMVLGTGWNAAFELLTRHIGKLSAFDGDRMMVNTEWENYTLPLLTKWDQELDLRPGVHGKQMLEKHVSGKYLG